MYRKNDLLFRPVAAEIRTQRTATSDETGYTAPRERTTTEVEITPRRDVKAPSNTPAPAQLPAQTCLPEFVAVELDLFCDLLVVPALLYVKALVDVVFAAVLAVDGEPVEAIVGVLDVHHATVVVDARVSLEDGAVALALDRDVRVCTPVIPMCG